MPKLCIVLRDQLSTHLSSIQACDPADDIVYIAESYTDFTMVKHHKKKIAFILSAMRHFRDTLSAQGYTVIYDPLTLERQPDWVSGAKALHTQHGFSEIVITEPSEWHVHQRITAEMAEMPITVLPDDRFLCTHADFAQWAEGKKQLRMAFFYQLMRQKYAILLDNGKPVGGKWSYDSDNRKVPGADVVIPPSDVFAPDAITEAVLGIVEKLFSDHFGDLLPFYFAVDSAQAEKVLDHFIDARLPRFGDYQDAMLEGEPWMFHAHISFYLNIGLLDPLDCIQRAQTAYYDGTAPLNAVEGFIRQILGWREYIRGIYWFKMPEYAQANFFGAKNPLPEWFWTGETKLNCLKQCITETKQNAYAHHIQRLMVVGNFALIAGLDPVAVNDWYHVVYADAYEWVELPNVSGMILFADGGYLASKPYAAGGAYINKMSNYCKNCQYKVSQKNGREACPFNYLYWDFLARNREHLHKNHRIGMMYKTYDRMAPEKKEAIVADSQRFIAEVCDKEDSDA